MEFPRFVYKDGGKNKRKGGFYSYRTVNSDADVKAALSLGWSLSLVELSEEIKPEIKEKVKKKRKRRTKQEIQQDAFAEELEQNSTEADKIDQPETLESE